MILNKFLIPEFHMRIGIVICPSSDLPSSFIKEHNIEIMPVRLKFPKEDIIDIRDVKVSQKFYSDYLLNKNLVGESVALTAEQIGQWFLDELVSQSKC